MELAAHFGAKETERLNGAHDLGQSSHWESKSGSKQGCQKGEQNEGLVANKHRS